MGLDKAYLVLSPFPEAHAKCKSNTGLHFTFVLQVSGERHRGSITIIQTNPNWREATRLARQAHVSNHTVTSLSGTGKDWARSHVHRGATALHYRRLP